jgi:NADPH:quinone reductase-like Zn-dependent oxidoreductase
MKKIVIHRPGGYDRLQQEEHPDLSAGTNEVLIDVNAIGVNFADCIIRMGLYESAKQYVGYPITPGFDVAGTVAAVGEAVGDFHIGERVLAVTLFNGYATQLAVDQSQVFSLPNSMSFLEAAAFPTCFLTAWLALQELAHPRPGETILVHSAAGGVGSALVQLGKLMDCRVIGVVGATHKVDLVRKLGADGVIDKATQDLWSEAQAQAPGGYDVILDANGVATLRDSYRHLAPLGRLVIYGFHSMFPKGRGKPNWLKLARDFFNTPFFNPLRLTNESRSVLAFNMSFLANRRDILIPALQQLLQWYREGELQLPPIKAFPFEEVAKAHQTLESAQTVGKLVLTVPGSKKDIRIIH